MHKIVFFLQGFVWLLLSTLHHHPPHIVAISEEASAEEAGWGWEYEGAERELNIKSQDSDT